MLNKKVLIIIGSMVIFLTVGFLILGLNYEWILGKIYQKDENFTPKDNQLFYNITINDCNGIFNRSENITFFQTGSTVHFGYQSIDNYVLQQDYPLIYNISTVDDHSTLHISFYVYKNVYILCMVQNQISGYLVNVVDLIDSVEFHKIGV